MLFNSLSFVFIFLPISLACYYALIGVGLRKFISAYLILASLVFYSVWNPPYTLLLIASIIGNYCCGFLIEKYRDSRTSRLALALGVLANLGVLSWYKYANFFIDNANTLLGSDWTLTRVILPLGISFYTFVQIGYLVDVSRGTAEARRFTRYASFVLFFPQLVAGPIVQYKEMVPQLFGRNIGRFACGNIAVGFTIFAIGLFKKTVIATTADGFAAPIFQAAHAGQEIGLLAGWTAAVTYTIQVYFDFSGYSDMAIGVARMFGLRLPPNFHSPLRAASIIEYWRRWHMSLQRFIVSNMYQPILLPITRLAAKWRLGKWSTFVVTVALPMVVLFAVIGLWHGPAWTYVLFGTMHGTYLATNEYWRKRQQKRRRKEGQPGPRMVAVYRALTLLAVAFANVMFRAEAVIDGVRIWRGMLRVGSMSELAGALPLRPEDVVAKPLIGALAAIAIIALLPNTQQFMARYGPVLHWAKWRNVAPPRIALTWRPSLKWALMIAAIAFVAISFASSGQTQYIYVNF